MRPRCTPGKKKRTFLRIARQAGHGCARRLMALRTLESEPGPVAPNSTPGAGAPLLLAAANGTSPGRQGEPSRLIASSWPGNAANDCGELRTSVAALNTTTQAQIATTARTTRPNAAAPKKISNQTGMFTIWAPVDEIVDMLRREKKGKSPPPAHKITKLAMIGKDCQKCALRA